jgi:DNA polymerase-1
VFGVPADEVTSAMRRNAKAVNFGIIYGQSPFGLAKSLGIPQEEAAAFIDNYFARYQGVARFMTNTLADCHRQGLVSTLLGRRRAIQGVRMPEAAPAQKEVRHLFDTELFESALSTPVKNMPDPFRRPLNLPERTAVNTVIQGSAADLIKLAMIAIARRLRAEQSPAKMVLQIHDELVFEVPAKGVDALAELVRDEMQGALALRVPLKVDVKSGDNWAECEPWTA